MTNTNKIRKLVFFFADVCCLLGMDVNILNNRCLFYENLLALHQISFTSLRGLLRSWKAAVREFSSQ